MAHGGKRKNSGRLRGGKNKKSRAVAIQATAAEMGITPLEFMLQLLRDDKTVQPVRIAMAVAAAPYVHARLSASTRTTLRRARTAARISPGSFARLGTSSNRPSPTCTGGISMPSRCTLRP